MLDQYTPAFLARFWPYVDKTGPIPEHRPELGPCWIWIRARTGRGYGQISLHNVRIYTHRVSWELENGPLPDGLSVLHHCDNPPCARPSHLFTGTQLDNMRDAALKHRVHEGDAHGSKTHPESLPRGDQHYARRNPELIRRGERTGVAKVTEDDVRTMRRMRSSGASLADIAVVFPHLQYPAISRICNRVRWSHVD